MTIKKKRITLILNIIIAIMELSGLIRSFMRQGFGIFQYYTEISNFIAFIVCIIFIVYIIKDIKNDINLPRWLGMARYLVTTSLMVTFLVVLFILIPTMKQFSAKELLFGGSMLYHHTLCPIISAISFIFFEKYHIKGWKDAIYGNLLTIIYAIISVTLNFLKVMTGPYPFLLVYNQPIYASIIWFIIIVGGSYLLALGLQKKHS